jgi:hypothetical protein
LKRTVGAARKQGRNARCSSIAAPARGSWCSTFRIGSISKAFCGEVLASMVLDGKLRFSDRLQDRLGYAETSSCASTGEGCGAGTFFHLEDYCLVIFYCRIDCIGQLVRRKINQLLTIYTADRVIGYKIAN